MGYGIGISIRVAGNQTIFNVASSYSMSAEEHLEKIKNKCKQTAEPDPNSTQTTRTQPKLLPRFCGDRLVALQPLHMSPSLIDRILHCTWPAKNTNCKQTTDYNLNCNYINKQKSTYQIFVFAHSFLFQVFAKN